MGVAALALMLGACAESSSDGLTKTSRASKPDGIAFDASLSCEGFCGDVIWDGIAGYCGCDPLCVQIGDCCGDKQQRCDQVLPTCEQAGGTCGALTAGGVDCGEGFEPDGDAGSCGVGGGCCMPEATPPTPPTPPASCADLGGQCGGLGAQGVVVCPDGLTASGEAHGCGGQPGQSADCCLPATASTTHELTLADDGDTVAVAPGDKVHVTLEGNPTTGYEWKLTSNEGNLTVEEERFDAQPGSMIGAGGVYHFTLAVPSNAGTGAHGLSLAYFRSWEGEAAAIETLSVTIQVGAK